MALTQRKGRQKGKYNRQLHSIELEVKKKKTTKKVIVKCLSSHFVRIVGPMCLSGKVSSVIMPDMYTNVVCFACLDRVNQHSSVEKRSKGEFSAHEPPTSLDLTQTVFLNVNFNGVILEHCDMVQMAVTVPSQPFNEPICLFVCLCVCLWVVMCPSTVFLLG